MAERLVTLSPEALEARALVALDRYKELVAAAWPRGNMIMNRVVVEAKGIQGKWILVQVRNGTLEDGTLVTVPVFFNIDAFKDDDEMGVSGIITPDGACLGEHQDLSLEDNVCSIGKKWGRVTLDVLEPATYVGIGLKGNERAVARMALGLENALATVPKTDK